jgi:hypothetical protein
MSYPNLKLSDGIICTPEDLSIAAQGIHAPLHCLTRGQSFGLLVISEFALLSMIAVAIVGILIVRNVIRYKSWRRLGPSLIEKPMDVYLVSSLAI